MTAMLIVLEYLTDTAVAPLQRDFVEIEDPFCSDVSGVQFTVASKQNIYLQNKTLLSGQYRDL